MSNNYTIFNFGGVFSRLKNIWESGGNPPTTTVVSQFEAVKESLHDEPFVVFPYSIVTGKQYPGS